VDRRDGHDLVPEVALRGTALIDIEMRRLGADDGIVRADQQADAEHVGCGAVEDEVGASSPESGAQLPRSPARPLVRSVGSSVTEIGGCDRLEYLRMRTGMVVAAKALASGHHRHRVPSTTDWPFTGRSARADFGYRRGVPRWGLGGYKGRRRSQSNL